MRSCVVALVLTQLSTGVAFSSPSNRPANTFGRPAMSTRRLAVPPLAVIAERPVTGSVVAATALVAGTTVGAGILALPASTLAAGFAPSSAALVGAWVYMASTGLLVAEVNVNTLCALEKDAVSINSMAEETLGVTGARLSSLAYVFIHYTLLVAYLIQGGQVLAEYVPLLPPGGGAPAFAALLGGGMLLSAPTLVDRVNSVLVAGVAASFVGLLAIGSQQVDPSLLLHADVPAVLPALPLMVLSLVYHNVVPTVCNQLSCDLPRIRTAIVLGSALPTLMFIAWSAVILGSVPYDAAASAAAAGQVFDPLQVLRASGDAFGGLVRLFSLLAVATSFVGFVYGLTDFFADLFGWEAVSVAAPATTDEAKADDGGGGGSALLRKAALYACTLLPPLGFALNDPSVFFAALDNAGTYGVLTLFGAFPAAMAWQQRYGPDADADELVAPEALPGGRVSLALIAAAALGVIGVETAERLLAMAS